MKNSVWNKKYSYAFASKHLHGESSDTCKHVALSSKNHPFPVLSAIVEGVGSRLSQQIALSLSLEAITEEFSTFIESKDKALTISAEETLEYVISKANSHVYQYGHRMAAGGQISACAIIGVLDEDGQICVGRVGTSDALLLREGQVMSFFKEPANGKQSSEVLPQGLGSNAKALAALTTMEVATGDRIALCGCSLSQHENPNKDFAKIFSLDAPLSKCCNEWLKTLSTSYQNPANKSTLPAAVASMLEIE